MIPIVKNLVIEENKLGDLKLVMENREQLEEKGNREQLEEKKKRETESNWKKRETESLNTLLRG